MFKNLSTLALGFSCPQYEQIELALSCGFAGMSLNISDFAKQVEMRGADSAARLITSASIKIGAWQLPVALDADEAAFENDVRQLPDRARIAAEIGALRAVAKLTPGSNDLPMQDNFELHRKRLSQIGKILADYGVRLGLEFQALPSLRRDKAFEFIYGQDALQKLVQSTGNNSLGLVVDVWQSHVAGGLDDIRKLSADEIIAVQICGAPEKDVAELTLEDRLLPGETGVIDIPAVLRGLDEINYDGPVTPSCHLGRYTGQRRESVIKNVGEAMNKIWAAAGLVAEQPVAEGVANAG